MIEQSPHTTSSHNTSVQRYRKWKKDTRAIADESDPKKWIDLVHPDEFPL